MKHFRSIKWLFALQAAVFVLLIGASELQILQLHYPRVVENDPLLAPQRVRAVSGDVITLDDGCELRVDSSGKPLYEIIQSSDFLVDLESYDDESRVMVFAKCRGWLCGTPWCGLIQIPLIADNVPINRREPIGFAHIVKSETEFEVNARP
jgi:hypothetical protein